MNKGVKLCSGLVRQPRASAMLVWPLCVQAPPAVGAASPPGEEYLCAETCQQEHVPCLAR
jgi:hypothetical protein